MRLPYVWIILRKELTEITRNRLALAGVFILPFLLYPLLMISAGKFAKSHAKAQETTTSRVTIWGQASESLNQWLDKAQGLNREPQWMHAPREIQADLEAGRLQVSEGADTERLRLAARQVITAKKTDAVLVLWPGASQALDSESLATATIFGDSVRPDSQTARERLEDTLNDYREAQVVVRERAKSLPVGFGRVLEIRSENTASQERKSGDNWGKSLPLLLFSTCVAAMLVMAIDMTAGEKDRATLQTLLCAPLRSIEIVTAKFLAVWAVGLAASLANGLSLSAAVGIVGAGNPALGLSIGKVAAGTLLLTPATALFAAGFLAIGAAARDAKDAGQIVSTIFSFAILPMAASALPGLELNAWTCFIPQANLSLLVKAIFTGDATLELALFAITASILYAVLMLFLAARAFSKETVLISNKNEIVSLFRLERSATGLPTSALAIFLYALVMVLVFYGSLALAKLSIPAMLLSVQFGGILLPALLAAWLLKLSCRQTFSLCPLNARNVVGSLVIGACGFVAVINLVLRWFTPPEELAESMKKILMLGETVPPLWQMLLLAAVTPAICEEMLFRGIITTGLRQVPSWARHLIVAFLFAFLHASIYRLAPTLALGLVLGLVVQRSGSLFACMIVHALNNGLAIFLTFSAARSGRETMPEYLVSWWAMLLSLAGLALGLWMLQKPERTVGDDK